MFSTTYCSVLKHNPGYSQDPQDPASAGGEVTFNNTSPYTHFEMVLVSNPPLYCATKCHNMFLKSTALECVCVCVPAHSRVCTEYHFQSYLSVGCTWGVCEVSVSHVYLIHRCRKLITCWSADRKRDARRAFGKTLYLCQTQSDITSSSVQPHGVCTRTQFYNMARRNVCVCARV